MVKALLKMKDICNVYGVTRFTVRRWCKAGLIPAPVRLSRLLRWDPDAVEAALKTAKPKPASEAQAATV